MLGGVLGLITFALLQTGLLVFASASQAEQSTFASNLGFLAVGFLSGFGWYAATQRIERLVNRFFAGGEDGKDAGGDEEVRGSTAPSGEEQDGVDERGERS